ncbi:MAG: hypothetical protein LUE26_07985, partial [Alistipes sp.]|nr:hypothetical protein [Alistipes sp.]
YGDNLFFALGFSQNSLNLINNNIPWSTSATTDKIYTPNKNYVIAPAIYQHSLNGFGPDRWSVAEFDLSYYYNYPSNTYANLLLYSTQISNLNASGFINDQIEGTMVSEAQYSSPGNKFNVGKTALDFGKVVTDKKFLDAFFKKDNSSENKTRAIAALPAIEMGAKALSAIIGGIMSKPQPQLEGFVSNFSSKLSAEVSLSGTITKQFNPVAKYFNIPGASAPLDGQYPDIDTKFGVWYLEEVPILYYHRTRYTYIYRINKTKYQEIYTDNLIRINEGIKIKLNPAIEKQYEIYDFSCGIFFEDSRIYEVSIPLENYQPKIFYAEISEDGGNLAYYRTEGISGSLSPKPQMHVSFWLVHKETGLAVLHSRAIDYDLEFTTSSMSTEDIYMPLLRLDR